jgi:hypothetical protein
MLLLHLVGICGDNVVSHGEVCDEVSSCCVASTCMPVLPATKACANTKRAILYLRSRGPLHDPSVAAPPGYDEYPGDPCRWTTMTKCDASGNVLELCVLFSSEGF